MVVVENFVAVSVALFAAFDRRGKAAAFAFVVAELPTAVDLKSGCLQILTNKIRLKINFRICKISVCCMQPQR